MNLVLCSILLATQVQKAEESAPSPFLALPWLVCVQECVSVDEYMSGGRDSVPLPSVRERGPRPSPLQLELS